MLEKPKIQGPDQEPFPQLELVEFYQVKFLQLLILVGMRSPPLPC